eukprot:CAMPEP_0194240326 /NCGR_PEP_ID=MMETSP0158-20130606/6533_1 /TAXON_ID=33649 /ORGANISM="Thalassionema nitzschioides, Strain L26-B" /LENGTH=933 /DNA_ID=CAMNT_0038975003 /DNA_START=178 /DNA_END=2979 /DNA_ORIENTATION=-
MQIFLSTLVLWFKLLLLLLRNSQAGAQTDDVAISPRGIISIERSIKDRRNSTGNACNFSGNIVFGGPSSLDHDKKFFRLGSRQLVAYRLMVDFINRDKCGIIIEAEDGSSQNYSLELRTYDDQSSIEWTTEIAKNYLASPVDIWLGGYSSTLTKPLAESASDNNKLLLAPGAASTPVFVGRDSVFGTFPPSAKYLAKAVEGLSKLPNGPTTMASMWEDASFTIGVCSSAPDLAEKHGLTMTSEQAVQGMTVEELIPLAKKLSEEDPDVVITCVYDCAPWMQAMRSVKWSPNAQIFTVCVGLETFVNDVGSDVEYIMGVTPWDSSVNARDELTNWTASDFADTFRKETDDVEVIYHSASAAAIISIAAQTLQNVGIFASNENATAAWSDYIRKNTFQTIYGQVSFDDNGQSLAPSLLIQYDENGTVRTVFPEESSSGSILYPMPSWDRRDCMKLSNCQTSSTADTCDEDGNCVCEDPKNYKAVGSGAMAQCVPLEDYNLLNTGLKILSYVAVAVLLLICAFAATWTFYYRKNHLVKVSQPMFLGLLIFGSVISSLSIIPMSVETLYRDADDIAWADAACMAFPWLWGLGFSISYSALFAKVWRVKRLYKAAHRARRKQVTAKDVMIIMAIVIFIEFVILLAFQFVSRFQWERTSIQEINGYTVESVGKCTSEYGWYFMAVLVSYNVFCLIYALILCWQTKELPSDFAEGNYIFLSVMFMFQVLILAIPVSIMVRENPNVYFFMLVGGVFLQNFTVLVIIFSPKMLRIYKGEDTQATVRRQIARTMSVLPERGDDSNGRHRGRNSGGTEDAKHRLSSLRSTGSASSYHSNTPSNPTQVHWSEQMKLKKSMVSFDNNNPATEIKIQVEATTIAEKKNVTKSEKKTATRVVSIISGDIDNYDTDVSLSSERDESQSVSNSVSSSLVHEDSKQFGVIN